MTKNLTFHVFSMILTLSLVLGCQSKGPTPKEGNASGEPSPRVGTTETTGAHPGGTADPHAGMAAAGDPHAGMAPTQNPHGGTEVTGLPDDNGMLDVGAVAFKVPGAWSVRPPKSQMRLAQLEAQGKAGPAELIVYFFGPQGAGTSDANIDRWIGQFANTDGSPVTNATRSSSKVSGYDVARVEVAGEYGGGMAPPGQAQEAVPGQRLLAAIVSSEGGPYYFKFLGPDATVQEHRAAFDGLIASIVASP